MPGMHHPPNSRRDHGLTVGHHGRPAMTEATEGTYLIKSIPGALMHITTKFESAKSQKLLLERGPAKLNAFFSQECTACGRQMRVRLEHLGRPVGCRHCGCQLVASDRVSAGATDSGTDALMDRANALLARQSCFDHRPADDDGEESVLGVPSMPDHARVW